jgi:pimeloyl-ACP methyl ester carboxylesterase
MTAAVARHYARSRFGQLHYVRGEPTSGTPSAPPLILLHQNPSSTFEYKWLIELMATDRIVIAFDTPGYGMSDAPPGPLSAADYAAVFSDGIDQLDLPAGKLDVYGFHTGTVFACELALARPDRIGRLVLTGVPYRTPPERAERLEAIHAVPAPEEDGEGIFKRLRWLWDFTVKERHPGVSVERAADIFIDRARTLNRYWWPYDAVWRWPVEDRLPHIHQDVLILQPDEMLRDQSVAAAGLLRSGTILEMPDLNRDIFEPGGGVAKLAEAMRAFLS